MNNYRYICIIVFAMSLWNAKYLIYRLIHLIEWYMLRYE